MTTENTPALQAFDFNTFPVRVTDRDDNPWFVAADVCRVLELGNPTEALRSLDADEKITLSNPEGNPRAGIAHTFTLISESGLYALIFKSRKPVAKEFRKWVTSEMLPTLRKTGSFALPGAAAESVPPTLHEPHCTWPEFFSKEGALLSFQEQTRVARLGKSHAKATDCCLRIGEPAQTALPVRVCLKAMEAVMMQRSYFKNAETETLDILLKSSDNAPDGATFRARDFLMLAEKMGAKYNRPRKTYDAGHSEEIAMGRRLQRLCGRDFESPDGRSFTLMKKKTKASALYVLRFRAQPAE